MNKFKVGDRVRLSKHGQKAQSHWGEEWRFKEGETQTVTVIREGNIGLSNKGKESTAYSPTYFELAEPGKLDKLKARLIG